jgi:hypothetical protein
MLVAASDFRGNERGQRVAATARILGDGELASRALRRKYGWQKRALELQHGLQRLINGRRGAAWATLEIVDDVAFLARRASAAVLPVAAPPRSLRRCCPGSRS